jgi:hypothetical protein
MSDDRVLKRYFINGACELIFKCFDEIILFLEIHMNNYTISQKGGNF